MGSPSLEFLDGEAPLLVSLFAWLSIIASYTIAASTTRHMPWIEVIVIKAGLVGILFAIGTTLHPMKWAVCGLHIEATTCGILETLAFDRYLINSAAESRRLVMQAKLLISVVAGHLLIPRALQMMSMPTHLSLGIHPSNFSDPMGTALVYGLLNECLMLICSSLFSRIHVGPLEGTRLGLTKQPVIEAHLSQKITIFYICLMAQWSGLLIAGAKVLSHPLMSIRGGWGEFSRSWATVARIGREFSHGSRLLLLGKIDAFVKFWSNTCLQADWSTILKNGADVLIVISFLLMAVGISGMCLLACLQLW